MRAAALLVPLFVPLLVADGVAFAQTDESSLLPLASLHRPVPMEVPEGEEPQMRKCASEPLPALRDRLPFGPGESLAYDVAILGVRTGKVNLRVGERSTVDGVATYPLQAQAKSDGFLAALGDFDARMVSFFDATALVPVRMVNRIIVRQPFQKVPVVSREDGAFAAAHITGGKSVGGNVNARLVRTGPDEKLDKTARVKSSADVLDLLSVVYYLRSRELTAGEPLCFELYHRRRLWRVQGKVGGTEVVKAPLGSRRAIRLDAVVTRGGADAPPPRNVAVFLSDDDDRHPVLIRTPDKLGDIELRLLSFARGRRLVAR